MFTLEQLLFAWVQVRAGSRSAGVDGITVDLFTASADEQLRIILRQLQQKSYRASPAKGFYLTKKSGGKRLVGISTVRDRIVQRLLLEELYLPLEDTFVDCSYAYRPGCNIQQAVQHLFSYYQYRPTWIVKADIAEFFDNLCWALLLTGLEKLYLEATVMELLEQQIKSGVVIAGNTNLKKECDRW
jgi:retron-type reverse transcriptase